MSKDATLVIGASMNPQRYSYLAILRLTAHDQPVRAIGLREGEVDGVPIVRGFPAFDDIDTVTLYINPTRQPAYYDYVTGLQPKRVIFNPGTENGEFEQLLMSKAIEPIQACTLVMLSTGQF